MRSIPVSLVALASGLVAGFGVGKYEAWWTIGIALGGVALAIQDWRGRSAGRAIATGAGVTAAAILAGMGMFLLFGSLLGGGTTWFAASAASIVISVGLLLFLRRSSSPAGPAGEAPTV
jgi:hypothetical protein